MFFEITSTIRAKNTTELYDKYYYRGSLQKFLLVVCGDDHVEAIIGFIAPNEHVKIILERLYKTKISKRLLLIEIVKHDEILEQAKRLVQKGANVIIARGGTYNILHHKLNLPVVNLSIQTTDILYALNKAKALSPQKNIYLCLHESIIFDFNGWAELLNIEVQLVKFVYNTLKDIEDVILNIKSINTDAVVIGGIFTTQIAERYGLKAVFLDSTESSIAETYNRAVELVRSLRDGEKKLKMLASILDNVDDAVLVINKEGTIEHANNPARKLFKTTDVGIARQNLLDVMPELELIFGVYKGEKISNHLLKINDMLLNINAVPLEVEEKIIGIVCVAQDITQIQSLEKRIRYQLHQKGLIAKYTFDSILTRDQSMIDLIENAKEFSRTDFTVLIYGESGTGKEMFAQSIHNWSKRKNAPFMAVNCAALTDSLLESELFGYTEGAFTGARKGGKQGIFELAHGGTIFLDEINSIPPKMQSKLLRIIEEKEVMRLGSDYVIPLDIRIIVASNENLTKKVMQNEFRSDLFYRLSVLELRLPPLRERKKDIIPLFNNFLKELKFGNINLAPELEEKLINHRWPGNVRELRNVAERYRLLKDKSKDSDLLGYGQNVNDKEITIDENMKIDLKEVNKVVENLVIETLINKGVAKNDIASLLGISRTALWKKMNPER